MPKNITEKDLKRGQFMYLLEAALEYLISILVAGSFLATLTKALGFTDSLTGILSSVISLGCLFQMLSVFYRPKQVKKLVLFMSVLNQLLFMLLYVIPVFSFSAKTKTILFIVFIFLAYLIYNFAHPKKMNWLMSLIDDHHRGRFTADKEILSLLTGMAFSYGMGTLTDYFSEKGQTRTAFILSAAVIFLLMLFHTLTMLLTPEPHRTDKPVSSLKATLRDLVHNKNILHVTILFMLYYMAMYIATPFYGTYQIQELGFSLKLVSILTIAMSLVRIACSRFWGAYADKNSFAKMIRLCLLFLSACYLFASFAVPANGTVMFLLYYLCHGIAQGGINSALTNLVFDYAPYETRSDSLAVCQAASGLCGFLATLLGSRLVSHIQASGNTFLGFSLYAQQVMSAIACCITIGAVFYTSAAFRRKEA